MQNDFVHPEGGVANRARERPEANIDMPFLMATIPQVKRLTNAFRSAGRPVVYVTQVLRPDYSDAAFPYWRATKGAASGNRTFHLAPDQHTADLRVPRQLYRCFGHRVPEPFRDVRELLAFPEEQRLASGRSAPKPVLLRSRRPRRQWEPQSSR
jgi:nicotinamidase-related amidase